MLRVLEERDLGIGCVTFMIVGWIVMTVNSFWKMLGEPHKDFKFQRELVNVYDYEMEDMPKIWWNSLFIE